MLLTVILSGIILIVMTVFSLQSESRYKHAKCAPDYTCGVLKPFPSQQISTRLAKHHTSQSSYALEAPFARLEEGEGYAQ